MKVVRGGGLKWLRALTIAVIIVAAAVVLLAFFDVAREIARRIIVHSRPGTIWRS